MEYETIVFLIKANSFNIILLYSEPRILNKVVKYHPSIEINLDLISFLFAQGKYMISK